MATVLVLGSNSFSGSDFIDLLLGERDYKVLGSSRSPEKGPVFLPYLKHNSPRFKFYQQDFNKDMDALCQLIDKEQPEYIVNFAAQSEVGPSWKNPWHWFQTNAVALARLIDHLKDKKFLKKYVHISSPEIYGSCSGTVTEEAHYNPSTPYAASKAAADFLLSTYQKNFDFPLVTVRATNVYGAHQQLFKIIPRTVINLKSGGIQELHGGGKAVKSYIHIRDVSRGELAIMEKGGPGEIYHLSPDQGIAVRDVVKEICACVGKDFAKVTKEVEERLGQDSAYVIDSAKARREFGWKPLISLDEGIEQVIDWVSYYWEDIKKMPKEYIHQA